MGGDEDEAVHLVSRMGGDEDDEGHLVSRIGGDKNDEVQYRGQVMMRMMRVTWYPE